MGCLRSVCGKTRIGPTMNGCWMNVDCTKGEQPRWKKYINVVWSYKENERGSNCKQSYEGRENGFKEGGRTRKSWLDRVDDTFKKREVRSLKNKGQWMECGCVGSS